MTNMSIRYSSVLYCCETTRERNPPLCETQMDDKGTWSVALALSGKDQTNHRTILMAIGEATLLEVEAGARVGKGIVVDSLSITP